MGKRKVRIWFIFCFIFIVSSKNETKDKYKIVWDYKIENHYCYNNICFRFENVGVVRKSTTSTCIIPQVIFYIVIENRRKDTLTLSSGTVKFYYKSKEVADELVIYEYQKDTLFPNDSSNLILKYIPLFNSIDTVEHAIENNIFSIEIEYNK